jgi:hypothetical protein
VSGGVVPLSVSEVETEQADAQSESWRLEEDAERKRTAALRAILESDRAELVDMIMERERTSHRLGTDGYLIGENREGEGIFLIWPDAEDSAEASILTQEAYNAIAAERRSAGVPDTHHVYACLWAYQTANVVFHQIPSFASHRIRG